MSRFVSPVNNGHYLVYDAGGHGLFPQLTIEVIEGAYKLSPIDL